MAILLLERNEIRMIAQSAAPPIQDSHAFEEAIRNLDVFLHSSSILNPDGSVNSGYDWKSRRYPFVYHEITGYAISVAVNCHAWWGRESHKQIAEGAVSYLENQLRMALQGIRGIPHKRDPRTGRISHRYYAFDNAIILQGLAAYGSRFPSDRALRFLTEIAGWLVGDMQVEDGSFLGYLDEDGSRHHTRHSFEADKGCLHVKHAIGLLRAAELAREPRFSAAAIKVCDWGLGLQEAGGLFWTNTLRNQVFTHAHCYAVEGLVFAHYVTGERRYLEAARRGADALAALQRSNGALPHTPIDRRPLRYAARSLLYRGCTTDATSQAVKIWLALDLIEGAGRYSSNRESACKWLLTQQVPMSAEDERKRGGLYYHRRDFYFPERLHRDMNTWPSQFALGALMSQDAWLRGELDIGRVMREWL
jgi:hypothetical protein